MEGQAEIGQSPQLSVLDLTKPHHFVTPTKKINEGQDVSQFLVSCAYRDIGNFIIQLNKSMCPRKIKSGDSLRVQVWELGSPGVTYPESVQRIRALLKKIDDIVEEAPPDPGPRRFGNVSFRKWFDLLESRVLGLLKDSLSDKFIDLEPSNDVGAKDELSAYLLGGFGSAQRLDYGTGHELSFLAFLGCLWKLGWFSSSPDIPSDGSLERSIVLGIFEPYLEVVRHLILTYTLEPAGSHGVWGLDDHFFLPYIFGSAQYCPAITDAEMMPIEGSLPDAPSSGDIAKRTVVDRERKRNMYFSAVGFINDVKTGPFWEHSPILFDISGVRSGWGKINKGMIKMYNAEVLSKFPVVQHFPFGSLFSWEKDPNAAAAPISIHTASQPTFNPMTQSGVAGARNLPQEGTRAPWSALPRGIDSGRSGQGRIARPVPSGMAPTRAPWANSKPASSLDLHEPTRAPWKMDESQLPKGPNS